VGYHLAGISSQKERAEVLDKLDNLYMTTWIQMITFLIASCDSNSSIGNRRNYTYCHPDGTVEKEDN
jgi:hypothetical protein